MYTNNNMCLCIYMYIGMSLKEYVGKIKFGSPEWKFL